MCIRDRLWEEFPKLIQQLNEYGDQNLIDTTRKLYSVLKRYDYLGTRNYAGLCAALKMYEDMLPVGENIDRAFREYHGFSDHLHMLQIGWVISHPDPVHQTS